MPTYVYKFVETGETIEVDQAFTDDTLTEYSHPDTGSPMAVKKVFQPVGLTFKGSGFYKTDSRSNSTNGTSSKSSSSDSSSSDSSSSKSSSDSSSSDSSSSKSDSSKSTSSDSSSKKSNSSSSNT